MHLKSVYTVEHMALRMLLLCLRANQAGLSPYVSMLQIQAEPLLKLSAVPKLLYVVYADACWGGMPSAAR